MSSEVPKIQIVCPDCETEIMLETIQLDQKFTCPECWAYLQITNLHPPEANWVVEEEEFDFELREDVFASKSSWLTDEDFDLELTWKEEEE